MRINTHRGISQTRSMLHLTTSKTSIKAYKTLSMEKHIRGQGSNLDNETKTSVPALIPIKSLNLCENTRACLDPELVKPSMLLLPTGFSEPSLL